MDKLAKKKGVGRGNHKNHYRLFPDKDVIAAIKASNGMLTIAAERLGITYQAIWNRLQRNPKIQTVYDEIRESHVDLSENKLIDEINKGNITAIIFHLKCLGKKRGYVERQEIEHSGRDGTPITFEHLFTEIQSKRAKEVQEAVTQGEFIPDSVSKRFQEIDTHGGNGNGKPINARYTTPN